MVSNCFGNIFRFTTWGESHGEAIGCVVDGVPAGLEMDESYIQKYLDERRPKALPFTTERNESDVVRILSGVYCGQTTGATISLLIKNQDQRSEDYNDLAHKFRPGHADYVYKKKYGIYDHRGGGRASARETAMRVASGAIARKILGSKIIIRSALVQIGVHKALQMDFNEANNNSLRCPDKTMVAVWTKYLQQIHDDGDSVGAMAEVHVTGVPIGLGEPIYQKLDALLASAIMSINAVKSFEIGGGSRCASMKGSEYIDEMYCSDDHINFSSNNSGGVIAGISTGEPLVIRFSIKPTGSIRKSVQTVDHLGRNIQLSVQGRHDVCIGIRAIPVAEAVVACVLADLTLYCGAMRNLTT